jgi:hypothetical protein
MRRPRSTVPERGSRWQHGIEVLDAAADERVALAIDPRVRVQFVLNFSHTEPELRRDASSPQDAQEDQALFQAGRSKRIQARRSLNQVGDTVDVKGARLVTMPTSSPEPRDEGLDRQAAETNLHRSGEGNRFAEDDEVAE